MKKCTKCGAINDNLYTSCIDCGAPLGPPLSREELQEAEKSGSKISRGPADKSDYFYVTKADKTVAVFLAAGALLQFFMISKINQSELARYVLIVWVIMVWMVAEAISLLWPKLAWRLAQLGAPRKGSSGEKPQPTEVALHLRKGLAYSMVFIGYALLVIIFLYFICNT